MDLLSALPTADIEIVKFGCPYHHLEYIQLSAASLSASLAFLFWRTRSISGCLINPQSLTQALISLAPCGIFLEVNSRNDSKTSTQLDSSAFVFLLHLSHLLQPSILLWAFARVLNSSALKVQSV